MLLYCDAPPLRHQRLLRCGVCLLPFRHTQNGKLDTECVTLRYFVLLCVTLQNLFGLIRFEADACGLHSQERDEAVIVFPPICFPDISGIEPLDATAVLLYTVTHISQSVTLMSVTLI